MVFTKRKKPWSLGVTNAFGKKKTHFSTKIFKKFKMSLKKHTIYLGILNHFVSNITSSQNPSPADRQTDRKMDRRIDRQAERHTD